jgi:hypothetical protein
MDMTPIINILERDDVLQLDNEEKTESENQYPCEIDIDIFSNSDQWELPSDIVERLTEIVGTRANNSNENEIWPEEISRGDAGIWDMCAWYKPIHYFAHDWGIYIREDCMINLAKAISSYVDTWALSSLGPQLFAKSVIEQHFKHSICMNIFIIKLKVLVSACIFARGCLLNICDIKIAFTGQPYIPILV